MVIMNGEFENKKHFISISTLSCTHYYLISSAIPCMTEKLALFVG